MMPRRRRMMDYRMDYRNSYSGSMGGDRDYESSQYGDGRRGVKGTGRYGIGGSRYYGRDRAYDGDISYDIEGEDYRRGRDYAMDSMGYRESPTLYRNIGREEEKFERTGKAEWSPYAEDGHYYPFEMTGGFGYRDPMYDYARGRNGRYVRDRHYDYPMMYDGAEEGMLSDKELEQWAKRLMSSIEEKDKPFFKMENIKKKAEDMGIKFDKFSPYELLVATLMQYTDYGKTLGSANMDTYIRLGKDFLCDPDAGLQYGMKLAAYYDTIVDGE